MLFCLCPILTLDCSSTLLTHNIGFFLSHTQSKGAVRLNPKPAERSTRTVLTVPFISTHLYSHHLHPLLTSSHLRPLIRSSVPGTPLYNFVLQRLVSQITCSAACSIQSFDSSSTPVYSLVPHISHLIYYSPIHSLNSDPIGTFFIRSGNNETVSTDEFYDGFPCRRRYRPTRRAGLPKDHQGYHCR